MVMKSSNPTINHRGLIAPMVAKLIFLKKNQLNPKNHMKAKFQFLKSVLALFSLMAVTASCNQEMESVAPVETREPITFNVTNETVTRGEIATSISSFNVYAYETDDASNVIIDNAEFTKNEAGVWSTDAMFYWTGNEITFCAYVPSDNFTQSGTTLTYTMPSDVTDQEDLMVAKDVKSTGSVSFSFERIMALVKFSVKGDGADVASVTLSGVADRGNFDMATLSWSLSSASTTTYAAGIGSADANGQITNSTGYLMVLPQTVADLAIEAENTNEDSKTYDLEDVEWVAGNLYNYTIDTDGITPEVPVLEPATGDDYTTKTGTDSNCYIVNPTTAQRVYNFPVQGRINDYWTNYAGVSDNAISSSDISNLTIEQLWSDCSISAVGDGTTDLGVSLIIDDNGEVAMQVVVPANFSKMGNAVYAVKKSGSILWSWHLWVTDYAPTGSRLNRYLGQTSTSSISGTMLYQFGRKDPFKTGTTRVANSSASLQVGVQNPTTAYTCGSYSWTSYGSLYNTYWGDIKISSSSKKSIFDPSPYGYRVASYAYMDDFNSLAGLSDNGDNFYDSWTGSYFYYVNSYAQSSTSFWPGDSRMWLNAASGISFGNTATYYIIYKYINMNSYYYNAGKNTCSGSDLLPVYSVTE